MSEFSNNIWILDLSNGDAVEESTFGLITEARRIIRDAGGTGTVTAVIIGPAEDDALGSLKEGGADKIIHIKHDLLDRYHGELFARVFFEAAKDNSISCILIAQDEGTSDFSARIAAMMNAPLVTKAMDFGFDDRGRGVAVRPVSNGYQFERVIINTGNTPVISFLPSVLSTVSDFEKNNNTQVEVIIPDIDESHLDTKIINIIEAESEDLDIKDAEIVVAGGRGAGKGDEFNIIHELAKTIGGSVGGTRPVIDSQLLPFERQIGQTGKTITPGLIINCGISGANEYSAGMEKAKNVISINKDPRARIFRFSDLSVVGDLRELIPLLIVRIREMKNEEE
ncbi:MAG: electron transfer flavoprotein subunit alpha/FixB family protein [Desulfobacteraceae bacterium]